MNHLCPCCKKPSRSVMTDPGVCCFDCFHALRINHKPYVTCTLHNRLLPQTKTRSALR